MMINREFRIVFQPKDTLSVLEAQLDSAYERVDDPFYVENKAWLAGQIVKLEDEIRKFKNQIQ